MEYLSLFVPTEPVKQGEEDEEEEEDELPFEELEERAKAGDAKAQASVSHHGYHPITTITFTVVTIPITLVTGGVGQQGVG